MSEDLLFSMLYQIENIEPFVSSSAETIRSLEGSINVMVDVSTFTNAVLPLLFDTQSEVVSFKVL